MQKYDSLNNTFNKDYKNKYTKMKYWENVAEKLGLNAEDAEKKFKDIRAAYGRYLKKQGILCRIRPQGSF